MLARDLGARATLNSMVPVTFLVNSLRKVEAEHQAAVRQARAFAADLFASPPPMNNRDERFRFGREPDGTPAEPWGWDDLD